MLKNKYTMITFKKYIDIHLHVKEILFCCKTQNGKKNEQLDTQ